MNTAHLHLLLNHVPVLGTIFGLLLLLWALLRGRDELKRLSLGVFALSALVALPVYLTGEPAEAAVEHLPGVAESLIERHESAAALSLVAILITGGVALAGSLLFRRAEKLPGWVSAGVLALALCAAGLLGWTANLGGQIRHPEIVAARAGETAPAKPEAIAPTSQKEREHIDKDDD